MDPLNIFGPSGLAIAVIIACVTQVLKEATGWEGKKARWLSLGTGAGLGLLLGLAGLRTTAGGLFPDVPTSLAGAVLGLLLGIVASGGYGMITWLQDRGVQKRVNMEASRPAPQVTVQMEAPTLPPCEDPAPPAAPDAFGGLGAEIEDLDIPALPPGDARGLLSAPGGRVERVTHPAFTMRPRSTVEDVLRGEA